MLVAGFLNASRHQIVVPKTTWVAVGLVCAVVLQSISGQIFESGTAWVAGAYLSGAALCMVLGATWQKGQPRQPLKALLAAILIAGFLTIGLQLAQWLGVDDALEIWSMGSGVGRPFANFGQPNQAATFLLWTLIAVAWLYVRGQIRAGVAVGSALFVLWGIALTHSRTAWLGLTLLLLASWVWRRHWRSAKLPVAATLLMLGFAGMVPLISWLNSLFALNSTLTVDDIGRMSAEVRPQAWAMFLGAVAKSPWTGYGINQVAWAQMSVAQDHPALHVTFSHGHNLFLDLVLWFGLPVGGLASVWLVVWFWKRVREVRNAEQTWPLLLILVMANHAMLELPLHYAYFLLPTCMLIGIASAEDSHTPRAQTYGSLRKLTLATMFLCFVSAATLWVLIARDYLRVEESYTDLRFELARIQYKVRGTPPDVVLLNQWHDFIELARTEPEQLTSPDQLAKTRATVASLPSPGGFYKLARALTLAGQPQEATQWLVRLCRVESEEQCKAVQAIWERDSATVPLLKQVRWQDIEFPVPGSNPASIVAH
jgi:O-antigen ligase